MKSTKAPILNPAFKWIPSASHDADSQPFRERQKARMAAADAARKAAKGDANVQPMPQRKKA